ncbi:MAG: hypothetical protein M3Q66_06430 [Chloroflexota bacterium]|nr:hypothetical protein [Chloroflexota bacterium]
MTDPANSDEPAPASEPVLALDLGSGPAPAPEPRPWLERIGLAAIAVVMGGLFSLVAVAAGAGGEWILAAMSAVGALMTIAVGLSTLIRG